MGSRWGSDQARLVSPALWVGFLRGPQEPQAARAWEDLGQIWPLENAPRVQRGGYLGEGEAGSREDWEETAASRQKGDKGGLDQESEKWADGKLSFPRLQRWERAGPAGRPRGRLIRDPGSGPRTSQAPGAAAWPATSPDY